MYHLGVSQNVRPMQASRKGEINNNKSIGGDLNTPLTPMTISTEKKISKESWAIIVLLNVICFYTYCSTSGMAGGDTIRLAIWQLYKVAGSYLAQLVELENR